MRIALSFPGCHRRGGVERVVLECANFLQGRGHDVHLFAAEWDEASLDRRVARHAVRSMSAPSPARLLTFARRCRRDLANCHGIDVLGSFGVQSPPGGVLWVTSVHEAWLEISRSQRSLKGRIRQRLNPFHPVVTALEQFQIGGRRYKKLIALTEQVKADLMRIYRVPAGDIEIIPNGFSPSEFNPDRASECRDQIRRELGFGAGDKVVVFVANELERKGFGPLLRAMAITGDSRARLLAVGHLNPNAYASEIRELGFADRVRFTGPSSDVARYYAAADVFALPTQYEAWGLVIVEAMACGLPVLTSRLAGAAVAVREGDSGYLLDDPRNPEEIAAKLRLLFGGSHAERAWISESVAGFAWQRVLLSYERVLRDWASASAAA